VGVGCRSDLAYMLFYSKKRKSNRNRGPSLSKTGLKTPGDPKPQLSEERNENSFENLVRRLQKIDLKISY